jgi:hyperosmotically inducible periplasmic protein
MFIRRKGRIISGFAAMVMIATLAVGCQALTGRTAGETVDDGTITASVKTKLAGDKLASLTRVDVDTTRGVVSLNGVVQSAEQRARVEELTRQVNGVKGVNNNLQVQKR